MFGVTSNLVVARATIGRDCDFEGYGTFLMPVLTEEPPSSKSNICVIALKMLFFDLRQRRGQDGDEDSP